MNANGSLDEYMYDRHSRPWLERPSDAEDAAPGGVDHRITTSDGVSLAATVWDPPGRARDRVLVVASATGVLQRTYAPFAASLAARGFAVVTFDYRGMGDSQTRAHALTPEQAPSMHDWGERDLASVLVWAGTALGNGRAALLGHSVGGQLVGLLPAHAQSRISALVTIGSQSGDFRLWPLPARLAMAVLWYGVVPGVTHAVGYLPGALGIGQDLPAGVALEWARWCRTPGYLVGEGFEARRDGFARLGAPVLAYGFDDDPYAPPAAVDALHALYVGARVERRQLGRSAGRFGHFGFFRPRHRALWDDVATFLGAHAVAGD
jgi:predicted alpha/beta hydrolase